MTWVPESCTLPTVEQPLRVAEFDALFALVVEPVERMSPTRLRIRLPVGDEIGSATRDLVAREAGCCSFFSFDVRPLSTSTELQIGVPESQVTVLDAIEQRADAARASSVPT
jgi:hypothetical protein